MYKRTDEQDPADKQKISPSFTNLYAPNFAVMHRTRTPTHHTKVSGRNIVQDWIYVTFSNTVAGGFFFNLALQNITCNTMFVFRTYFKLLLLHNFN